MKKAAIIAVMLLLGGARAGAQAPGWAPDSCLVLWQDSPLKPHGVVWTNPDSVEVDLCDTGYPGEYAKREFDMNFLYYIIPDSLAPIGDSLERDWRDIDTNYSAIRNGFDTIEQLFGPFTIQHVTVSDTIGDTGGWPWAKRWYVNFKNYVNIDTVDDYLYRIPGLDTILFSGGVRFDGSPGFYEGVNQNATLSFVNIWPQPSSTELFIEISSMADKILFYDPLGRVINLPIISAEDGLISVDVSNQQNGVLFSNLAGRVFKIIIQH